MSILLSLFLSAAGPIGEPGGGAAASQTTPASVDEVRVVVDHSALLDEQMKMAAEDSAFYVHEDSVKALREQHGVEVTETEQAPAILVGLAWEDYDRTVYRIRVATQRPGQEPVEVVEFTARCIDSSALTKAVVDRLPAALAQLVKVEEPAGGIVEPAEGAQGSDDAASTDRQPNDGDDAHRRRPLGVLGKVGIGLAATGGAGLIAGGVVLAQGRQLENPTLRYLRPEGRDYRPPGIATLATASAITVAGVALLVVDRVRARRGLEATTRASLLPVGPSVSFTLRF